MFKLVVVAGVRTPSLSHQPLLGHHVLEVQPLRLRRILFSLRRFLVDLIHHLSNCHRIRRRFRLPPTDAGSN
jgi:hypothetical protein